SCTGTTTSVYTATWPTCHQQSSRRGSTLRNGPTNPWSESNSPSLHQTQGDSQTRRSALLYALSSCSLPGLRRRGPRRDRIAGMALTKGLTANPSGVLAAEMPVARGSPPLAGEHMQLRARLVSVDRIRSGHSAPLVARTAAASTTARDQSISP